jgi:uncharacterized protein with HEPN domain
MASGREAFLASDTLIDAVIRSFEVIGEASKHLSTTLKTRHPNIQWQKITDFRNFLIHRYFEVEVELVWNTAATGLNTLKSVIEKELNK